MELAKRLLPLPPAPAVRDDRALAGLEEVEALAVDPLDLGAGRHGDDLVLAARAVAALALAVAAAAGAEVRAVAQRREVAARRVADEDDVAAGAAVAAVGAALAGRAPRGES